MKKMFVVVFTSLIAIAGSSFAESAQAVDLSQMAKAKAYSRGR